MCSSSGFVPSRRTLHARRQSLFCCSATSSHRENVQGGIKFDVAYSTLSGLSDAASRSRSWDLGGFLEVKLGNRWSISPELHAFKSPAGRA